MRNVECVGKRKKPPSKRGLIMVEDQVGPKVSIAFTVAQHQRCLKLGTQLSLSV